MLSPTPDRLRGLARSSPWRWRALAFDLHRRPLTGPAHTVDVLVERGVGIEVRLPDGKPQRGRVVRNRAARHRTGRVHLRSGERASETVELPYAWEVPVQLDGDGFVVRRPAGPLSDDPMWQDYQFVAMLDPVELADGVPGLPGTGWRPDATPPPALDVLRLDTSVRHGRLTWWAEASPRADYSPRCSCCPLLFGEVSDSLEAAGGAPTARERRPGLVYSSAYLVALDVQTGVCVHVEHLDGDHAGRGFSVDIRAVDPADA